MSFILPSFPRLVAALMKAEELKTCRGRYDNKSAGIQYCNCDVGELCQQRLSELLGLEQSTMTSISYNLKRLAEEGIISIRWDGQNPPGKPRKYYRLAEDWRERLMAYVEKEVAREAERLAVQGEKQFDKHLTVHAGR